MKNFAKFSLALIMLTLSCENRSEVSPRQADQFEGTWIWVETAGIGFDGLPYYENPTSVGYSQEYSFYDSNGHEGKLQTFKNEDKHLFYRYKYGADENGNQVIFDRLGNALPDAYSWEIREMNSGTHLYLRGRECCDKTIEQHFIRKQ